ncbi:MAG: hypothetical protein AAB701_02640 [Patescibacteria group bacterium]
MATESRPDQQFSEARLAEALEDANKLQRSPLRPIWQGTLFGIGSTVGLGLALYLLSIILRPFTDLPVLGDLIRVAQPSLDQTLTTPIDTETDVQPAEESSSTVSPTSTDDNGSHSTIKNNYFSLKLPGSWSLKINQGSGSSILQSTQAESSTGTTFTATVSTTSQQPKSVEEPLLQLESQQTHDGNYYLFTLSFDPNTDNGQQLFNQILATLEFQP